MCIVKKITFVALLSCWVNILFAQQDSNKKWTVKEVKTYFYHETSNGHYSDSFWLAGTVFASKRGDNILGIYYNPDGDIKEITVFDIDSVSKHRVGYRDFDNRGWMIKERKREYDEKGALIKRYSSSPDIKEECKRGDTCITCKYNQQGDIVYFEQRSPEDKNYILQKFRREYEYWEEERGR